MRKDLYPLRLFVALFVLLSTIALFGQTPVEDWGFIGGRNGGWGVSMGTPGNVTASGTAAPGGWMAVRGQFPSAVTATQSDAIVITGSIEFVNAGITNWSGLRYGFFYHDSAGVLEHTGTDSVRWSGSEAFARGYMVTPHSGVNDQVGWANGGNGTQGV
ncbi:MAG TPA: hypothetical protein PLG66_16265, partial [Calditrichia bacterium]|nr:hypothetical protein [Calditrichia bacterium]